MGDEYREIIESLIYIGICVMIIVLRNAWATWLTESGKKGDIIFGKLNRNDNDAYVQHKRAVIYFAAFIILHNMYTIWKIIAKLYL